MTVAVEGRQKCTTCATELASHMRACPSCRTLVHGERLKSLATSAQARAAENDVEGERAAWEQALALLPPGTQQHDVIRARVATLNESLANAALAEKPAMPTTGPWWKRGLVGSAAIVFFALGKLKFLLLGLTKASTFFSMFAFFGVYWHSFGWPLALGLVVSIYIHEMGHVAMLKRLGIAAGAPVFIPGIGALVRLKQHVANPVIDARVGLAGPVWGLGAAVGAYGVAKFTASPAWFAIAQLGGYVNLFNLIPVWQLDGSRGLHAMDRAARLLVAAVALTMFFVTAQRLLIVIAAIAAYRALKPPAVKTDRTAVVTFAVLLIALSMIAEIHVRT